MALMRLQDVSKSFGKLKAVDEVSFTVDRGEVVGFLGPNGAGKTTTMRLITQILEPDTGTIEIDGHDVTGDRLGARQRIGYLPETNPLYVEMLASEYLSYIGRLRGMSADTLRVRTDAVVDQTGIPDVYYRPIGQLSKGYRQRVGLAAAILSEPDILILDEPTEGLDPNQRVEIRDLITHLGAERTVLLSTHVMQEVQLTCSRLLIIHEGRIIADGAVDSLLAGAGQGIRVSLEVDADRSAALREIEALETVAEVRDAGDAQGRPRFVVVGAPGADPRPDLFGLARRSDWTLWEMHREREDLEQFFRALTEKPS